jgi:hypothetical protein
MYKELCVELLLPGDENNKDGNTYLCYDREGWKGKKTYLGISTKGMKLDFCKARMKRKRETKGTSSDFKKSYIF